MNEITDMHDILYEHRIGLGLTQKQAAEKAGLSLSSYQKFECGYRNIMTASFCVACRLIEALDMNVSDFYHKDYILGEVEITCIGGKKYSCRTPRKPVQRCETAR